MDEVRDPQCDRSRRLERPDNVVDTIAAQWDGCSPRCSNTIRTARSRTATENVGDFCRVVMAPVSQELEPPANPVRIRHLDIMRVTASFASALPRHSRQMISSRRYPLAWPPRPPQHGSLTNFTGATARRPSCWRSRDGQEAHSRPDCQTAFAPVVRQSRQSRHDRALSRALHELGHHARGTASRQANHRHRAIGLGPVAVQSPPHRAGRPYARRHPRGRRHRFRIPRPPDPGDGQAADRQPRPQPRLSRPGRGALRLPTRCRRADHGLRQDHALAADGGGDRRSAGNRAVGRSDVERLVPRRAHGLGHDRLEGAQYVCGRRDRLSAVHRAGGLVGAVARPLQHHGHGLDHEQSRRGLGHVAAGLRRHSRRAQGAQRRSPTRPASASSTWSGRICVPRRS